VVLDHCDTIYCVVANDSEPSLACSELALELTATSVARLLSHGQSRSAQLHRCDAALRAKGQSSYG